MPLIKRSLSLHGHRTSLALEPEFWAEVERQAQNRNISMAALLASIDDTRDPEDSLSSSVRVFVLQNALKAPAPSTD